MGIMKPINAYLTAFLKHTPGLILVLMLIGCRGSQTPVSTDTPTSLTPAAQGTAGATVRPTRTPAVTATITPAPTITAPISTLDVQAEQLSGLTMASGIPGAASSAALLQNILNEF